jgi:hypothetical protein
MLYVYKSKLLAENIDDDKYYYRKLDNLIFASDFTVDADNDGVPDLWRISNSKDGLLEVHIEDEAAKITNQGEGTILSVTKQDINIQPGETYKVNLLIGSESPKNKPVINIYSRKGKSPQHQIKNLDIDTGNNKYNHNFYRNKRHRRRHTMDRKIQMMRF